MTFRYNRTPTGELPGNSLITQTEAALSALSGEATEAKEAAQAAQTAAEDAASQASAAASSAAASAAAAESAAQPAAVAQQALTVANQAETTAQQAVTSASAAVTAAQAAQTASENAASDAEDAADAAAQAVTDAQAAQGAASASQTAAESAQTSAGQAATIATQAQSAAAQSAQSAAQAAATVAASARQIGEIVTSTLPLSTVGLHLLDGAVIDGDGIYAAFVEYVANLDQSANYFCTEAEWQQSITDSGMCGKFVYDSVANSVRLPKLDGAVIQGDIDIATLGDLVSAGLDSSAPTQTVKSFIYIVIANSVASSTPVDLDEIVEKALDAVTMTEDQTISGEKTFTTAPIVPTQAIEDFSQKAASTAFVQTKVRSEVDQLQAQLNALEGAVLTATDNTAVAYSKAIQTSANLFKYAAIRNFGGRSIAWNQGAPDATGQNWAYGSVVDGTRQFTATYQYGYCQSLVSKTKMPITGHKYYFGFDIWASAVPTVSYRADVGSSGCSSSLMINLRDSISAAETWTHLEKIATYSIGTSVLDRGVVFVDGATAGWITIRFKNVMLVDLTLLFGAGNEPSTVEEFRAIFPEDYYAYSAGEIKSAGVNKIISKDSNSDVLAEMNIPAEILALPGYGWSAGTAKNWVDWENKVYHKEVGQVDLGEQAWTKVGIYAAGSYRFGTPLPLVKPVSGSTNKANILCSNYVTVTANDTWFAAAKGICVDGTGTAYVYDEAFNGSTVADFKTAMAGVKLNYELATPVETDISALIDDNTIEVESGGSLTFENTGGDSYRIPVPSSVVTMEKP